MYYAAGILASSETAGGRPGRAWSAPSSSSCSRSLSRANTPSPRLLHVSLTITLRRSVSSWSSLRRSNTLLTCPDVPGSHSAFLCRVKGHTRYAEEGEQQLEHYRPALTHTQFLQRPLPLQRQQQDDISVFARRSDSANSDHSADRCNFATKSLQYTRLCTNDRRL